LTNANPFISNYMTNLATSVRSLIDHFLVTSEKKAFDRFTKFTVRACWMALSYNMKICVCVCALVWTEVTAVLVCRQWIGQSHHMDKSQLIWAC